MKKLFFLTVCFIFSLYAEKPGLAVIYKKQNGWMQVELPMMELLQKEIQNPESTLNKFQYVLVDVSSEKDLPKMLQELKDKNGIKLFIGLAQSQTIENCLPFLKKNPDCIAISVGSTAIELEKKDNLYRLALSDKKALEGFSYLLKSFQGKHIITFYQSHDSWSKDIQDNLKKYFPVVESLPIDSSNPSDIVLVEKTIQKHPQDAIYFCFFSPGTKDFFEKTADIWIKNPRRMFGGDGSIHFPFTGKSAKAASRCHFTCNEYFGFASPLIQEMVNPYAVNILDAIDLAYDFSISKKTMQEISENKIGYVGYLDLNEFGDKKYGSELFYEFTGTRWKLSSIYNDEEIMRYFSPVEEKPAS